MINHLVKNQLRVVLKRNSLPVVFSSSSLKRSYARTVEDINPTESQSPEEAHLNTLRLYRYLLSWIPYIRDQYRIPTTEYIMKERIRMDFEKNRNMKEVHMIDQLIFRGYNELEEMRRFHQTKSHVLKYFSEAEPILRQLTHRSTADTTKQSMDILARERRLVQGEEEEKKKEEKLTPFKHYGVIPTPFGTNKNIFEKGSTKKQ